MREAPRSCWPRGCSPRAPTCAPGTRSSRAERELDGVDIAHAPLEAVRGADAAVIVTEWPELRELASAEMREAMRTPLIVDGRNLLDPEAAGPPGSSTRASAGPSRAESLAWKRSCSRAARPSGSAMLPGLPEAARPDRGPAARGLSGRPARRRGRRARDRSCAAGQEELFEAELAGIGPEIVDGRGARAARARRWAPPRCAGPGGDGPVYA